ncbi:MAG: hypothetical protein KDA80_06170 [Planctomycetaceae bacterium]|nr:hypothetical protein [Planctomycetaceae bacterium]
MSQVLILGWKPGFQKVAMNHLLQAKAGLGLREAKAAVDDILEERPVVCQVRDAETFRLAAQQLGAVCYVISPSTNPLECSRAAKLISLLASLKPGETPISAAEIQIRLARELLDSGNTELVSELLRRSLENVASVSSQSAHLDEKLMSRFD